LSRGLAGTKVLSQEVQLAGGRDTEVGSRRRAPIRLFDVEEFSPTPQWTPKTGQ